MSRRSKKAEAKDATAQTAIQEKKATTGAVVEITPEQREARRQTYLQSDTYTKVNAVNKQTKEYARTLKGARSLLLNAKSDQLSNLTSNFQYILRASKKSELVWKHMQDNVRVYQSGKVGTHVILQWCKKFEAELIEMVKSGK
jgi:hypothetical protein